MSIIRITKEQVVNAQKVKEKTFEEDIDFKTFEEHKESSRKRTIKQPKKEAK